MYTIFPRNQASLDLTKSKDMVSIINIERIRHKAATMSEWCVYGLCNVFIEDRPDASRSRHMQS
jgi:hypothetical protein